MQDQYFKEKCWSINGILSYLEKKMKYSRILFQILSYLCILGKILPQYIYEVLDFKSDISICSKKTTQKHISMNVEYAYGNMREQVVWHLWSFTFLSVTNFLDSLSRTVGVPYHLYAELVRSKSSSIQFLPKLQQKSGYTIYGIPFHY